MNIYSFITEFNILMKKDKYISKREVDTLLSKYDFILNDISKIDDINIKKKTEYVLNNISNIIAVKNEKFLSSKLIEYKDYFDNMFKGIDDNIVLDQEQRLAILTDEDYSLVIAGAGSGKTTTMAAKVKYLVEKMHIKEDKIILLAFTNKACEELQTRINEDFKLNVEVLTFHKLGMKFLRKIINKPITIVGPGTFNRVCEDYITNVIFKNKEKLKDFMETFKGFVFFDDKALSYETFDEYYKYYADKTYELNKDNLKRYCDIRIKTRLDNNRSISGEVFRSMPEAMIANYFYINSIPYTYEKAYPHKLKEGRISNKNSNQKLETISTSKRNVKNLININNNDLIADNKLTRINSRKSIPSKNLESNKTILTNKSLIDNSNSGVYIEKKDLIDIKEYLSLSFDENDFDDVMDKEERTYCEYFSEKFKENQIFINAFFMTEPLRPKSIKILVLIVTIELYFTVNALFYTEEYLSSLLEIEGEDSFFAFVPRRFNHFIYIVAVIGIITYIIGYFFIEEKKIKKMFLRNKEGETKLKIEISNVLKDIRKRFLILIIICIFFCIISFIYISCFNNVYPNSKSEWIKSSLFIIIITQLINLILTFAESSIRYMAIKCNSEKMFKLSLIIE